MHQFKKKDIAFDSSKLVKTLGRNTILVPALEKAFKTFDEPWDFKYEPKQHDDAWHPSGDCTPTVTELYQRATTPHVKEVMSQKNFIVGHFWHQLIQFLVVREGMASERAIEREGSKHWDKSGNFITPTRKNDIRPYHWVHGSGDIVPLNYANDWEGLVDIKTMRTAHYKESGLPHAFAERYICQINIYMDLFDQEQGMFLCVHKDTGDMKEITFVRNQPLIDAIYDKLKFVSYCLDNDIIPSEEDDLQYQLPEVTND